jgi:hypothetical protein
MMQGLGSVHKETGGIDTAVLDSLIALNTNRPIGEADMTCDRRFDLIKCDKKFAALH